MQIVIEKLAFELETSDRGFTVKAFYLSVPKGEALVEIQRGGEPYRRFLYPAYKIWNIAAHFKDIVNSETDGNMSGYDLAGWTGFNVISPTYIPLEGDGNAKTS
jgi:hypothetical protein